MRILEEDNVYILESLNDAEDFLVLREMNFLQNQENPESVLVQAAWDSGSNDRGAVLPGSSGCIIPPGRIFTVTGLTLTVCAVVFMLQTFLDGGTSRPVFDALSLNADRFNNGEYWRIITPAFMHFGFVHIAFNAVIFAMLGWQVEKFLGSFRLLVLIVIAGIVGNVSEYCILAGEHEMPPENFGGLSGAVNGVIGYLSRPSRADANDAGVVYHHPDNDRDCQPVYERHCQCRPCGRTCCRTRHGRGGSVPSQKRKSELQK